MSADTMQTIIGFINNVGFPIAVCCFMGWYLVKLQNTINNLTIVLTEMKTTIEKVLKKDDD